MGNALFICSHIPSQSAVQAGHKTAWNNLRNLSNKYDIHVIILANKHETFNHEDFSFIKNENIKLIRINFFDKFLNWVFSFLSSPRFAVRRSKKFKDAIDLLMNSVKLDLVWFEFTESAVFATSVRKEAKFILSAPDIITQWSLRRGGFFGLFSSITYKEELKIFSIMDQIIVQSSKDIDLISSLFNINNVSFNSPTLSNFIHDVSRHETKIKKNSLLFWGAMDRRENEKSILNFINNSWPIILDSIPDATLFIVGSSPSSKLKKLSSANIVVTGFVENPAKYFEIAHLGIAPLIEGAGIKVKVLEMLKTGMKVVATPIAAEGIEINDNIIVCDNEKMFSDSIITYFMKNNNE